MSYFSDDHCETLMLVTQAVKSGKSLSDAIRLSLDASNSRSGYAFSRLADQLDKGIEPITAVRQSELPRKTITLFEVALESGDFQGTFEELVSLEERRLTTRRLVLQSLTYILLVVFFAFVVGFFSIAYVVPRFVEIFDSFETELPMMTQCIVELAKLARDPGSAIAAIVFFGSLYFLCRRFCPRIGLYFPLMGGIARNSYKSHFLRLLSSQVRRDVPLPDALEQCGKTMSNPAYAQDCRDAATAARSGGSLSLIATRFTWLFPVWVQPMIAENVSKDSMVQSLRRAADLEDRQQEISINLLQTLSVPICIFLVLQTLGFAIIALFLPLIKLITELSSC